MTLVPSYLAYRRNKVVSRQLEDTVSDYKSRSRLLHAQITAEMKVTRRWMHSVSRHSGYAFSADHSDTTVLPGGGADSHRGTEHKELLPPTGKTRNYAWGPSQQVSGKVGGHVQGHTKGPVQGQNRGDEVNGAIGKTEVTMATNSSPSYIRQLRLQRSKSDIGVYPVVVPAVLPVYLVQARRDKENKQKQPKQKHRPDLLMRSRTDGAIQLDPKVTLTQRMPCTQRSIMADMGKDSGKVTVPVGKSMVPSGKVHVPSVTEGSPGTIKLAIRAKVPTHLPACAGTLSASDSSIIQAANQCTKHTSIYPSISLGNHFTKNMPSIPPPTLLPSDCFPRPPTCPTSDTSSHTHQNHPVSCPAIYPAHLPSQPPPHRPRRSLSQPAASMRAEELDNESERRGDMKEKSNVHNAVNENSDQSCKDVICNKQSGKSMIHEGTTRSKEGTNDSAHSHQIHETRIGNDDSANLNPETPKVTITIKHKKHHPSSPNTPNGPSQTSDNDKSASVCISNSKQWEQKPPVGKLTQAIIIPLHIEDNHNSKNNTRPTEGNGAPKAGKPHPGGAVSDLEVRGVPVKASQWCNPFPVQPGHQGDMVDPIEEVIEANRDPSIKAAATARTKPAAKDQAQGYGSNRRYSIFLNAWHNLPTSQEMSSRMIGRTPARPRFLLQKKFRRAVNASIISQRFKGPHTQPDSQTSKTQEEEERMAEFRQSVGVVKYIRAVSAGNPIRYGEDDEVRMSGSRLKRARKSLTLDRLKDLEKPRPPPQMTNDKELETRIKVFLTKT